MAVYFIRAGSDGPVKIGRAVDPRRRLQGLQTGHAESLSLVRVLDGDADVEKALHARFSCHRLAGEWFTFAPEMLAKDIGYPDVKGPYPASKSRRDRVETAFKRRSDLQHYIVTSLGGPNEIARRLGARPWLVFVCYPGSTIAVAFYEAVADLMSESGNCNITASDLHRADRECEEEAARREAARTAEDRAADAKEAADTFDAYQERLWLKRNAAATAWWPLRPENQIPVIPTPSINDNTPPSPEPLEAAG